MNDPTTDVGNLRLPNGQTPQGLAALNNMRIKSAAANARIKVLEAIVNNLPKTEDGVLVTPGMELWSEVGHIGGIGMGWAIMAEIDEEEAPGDAVLEGYWASPDALKEHIEKRNQSSKETP